MHCVARFHVKSEHMFEIPLVEAGGTGNHLEAL